MRSKLAIFAALSLTAACFTASASVIQSCPSNVAVTSSLVFNCSGSIFDFGHDLSNNPMNPLPLGGSVFLKSVTHLVLNDGFPEWDLDFGFPSPSVRTTAINFTLLGPPCDCLNGVAFFGLGLSPSPFGSLPPNTPNESGSDFVVNETATDLAGHQTFLSMSSGNVVQDITDGSDARALEISTVVSDSAGDLTGFNEGFAAPEPGSWALLLTGLAGIAAFWRRSRGCLSERGA